MVEGNIVGGVDSIGGERVEEEAMAGAKVVGGKCIETLRRQFFLLFNFDSCGMCCLNLLDILRIIRQLWICVE